MRPRVTRFLPDRLRPAVARRTPRRRRWWWLALGLLSALLVLLPCWRVRAVAVDACGAVPPATRKSLSDLVGTPVPLVDLQWVRGQLEAWPGVRAVEVELELAGKLRAVARPCTLAGSIPTGRRYHGLTGDGAVAGSVDGPLAPLLEGFPPRPEELGRGLGVVRRLEQASGAAVERVERVTPVDWLVLLRPPGAAETVAVRVGPTVTESEGFWCRQARAGARLAPWSDLRGERRLVLAMSPAAPSGVPAGPEAAGEPL